MGIVRNARHREERAAVLADRWRAASAERLRLDPIELECPAADDLVLRICFARDPEPACESLGTARAEVGLTASETFEDVAVLAEVLPRGLRGRLQHPGALAALATGWARHSETIAATAACRDPSTGLHSIEYLCTAVGQLHSRCKSLGRHLTLDYALFVVDVPPSGDSFVDGRRSARLAQILARYFDAGELIAANGLGNIVVLVRRSQIQQHGLGVNRMLGLYRAELAAVPRIWTEPLPTEPADLYLLLADLRARRIMAAGS